MSSLNVMNNTSIGNPTLSNAQSIQKKKEEEAAAAQAKDDNSPFKTDVVTISDQARLIINSQLGKFDESEKSNNMLMNAADAEQLATQIEKAQDEMDAENSVNDESATDSLKFEKGGSAAGAKGAAAEEEEEEDSSLEAMISSLDEQITAKEAEIQALAGDSSEEAQTKSALMQAEIALLRSTLSSLEQKQLEEQQA